MKNESGSADPWLSLGKILSEYMKQVSDTRLNALYDACYKDGWANPVPMPLSTRHAFQQMKDYVMEAISQEIIERREGRIPRVPDGP